MRHARRDDTGATLILALIFLVVVSATVLGLSSWAQGDLNSTRAFVGAQSFQSAANDSTQVAIQYVRYNFLQESLNASPPTLCWASNGPTSLTFTSSSSSETVDSWCSTRLIIGLAKFRIVTISTCLKSVSSTACEKAPLLQAIVKVFDTDQSGNWTCLPVPTGTTLPLAQNTTCGQGLVIQSWAFSATPPEVTAVSATGTCAAGATVSITGTGFANIVAVDAVLASSTARASELAPWQASFTVSGTTQISASLPSQMPSGQYDMRVSTSAGSSALAPGSSFSC